MTFSRQTISWALYDWANSGFAVVVLAGFYPIFFRDYWAVGQDSEQITFYLGAANSIASVIIVLLAPMMGSIADRGGIRKRLLIVFAGLGLAMTAGLFWVQQGEWGIAAALFVIATVGWMGANVFYDALLIEVSSEQDFDQTSALGYGLGYLGGGLLFALCVLMTLHPDWFWLNDTSQAVRISFLLVALWWAVFSIPLWRFVHEPGVANAPGFTEAARQGLRQLIQTFHEIRQLKPVLMFLLAYWLYIDGVDTIIRMAVDYGKAIGFGSQGLITALLITQFIGFPAALMFGWLGGRIGAKRGILIGIAAYFFITFWAYKMDSEWEFYGLACCIGLAQGGIQSLSRSYYARLIPSDKAAEFFGFYNMLGKFAAIIGPLLVGWTGVMTGSPRTGLLSLLILFTLGGLLLILTPGQRHHDRPSAPG